MNYPVNFNSNIPSVTSSSMNYGRVSMTSDLPKQSFKDVMCDVVSNVNGAMNKPDELLTKAATGTGDVDIHDVMVAMSQAEITLTVATNCVTKVIQAYDKIVQIQV